MLNKKSANCF